MDEEILDIENLDAPEKTEEQKKREEERKDQPARIIPSSLFLNPEALLEINKKALDASKYLTGERLITRIKERVDNVPERKLTEIEEVGPFEGFAAGIIDGSIKLPYGFVTLAAEVKDALGPDNVPIEESNVAKLQEYFDNTVLGKIQKGAEDTVKESAIGRLTTAFTQLYGTGRIAASGTIKAMEKANEVYNKFSKAAKLNKVVKANPNAVKAGIRAKELNKLSGKQKFLGVTLGGGLGTGLVVDIEDIGTWGDVLGGPTQLDREPIKEADDDAVRKLWNRFKFGSEAAAVSVPIVYGINTIAKRISEAGKDLRYSNDQLDRLIDKYIVKPFVPRGGKPQKVFEGMKKVEGKISAGQVTARDLIKDIDRSLYEIAKTSGISTRNPAWKRLIGRMDELLTSTDDIIQGSKVTFKGFDDKQLTEFRKFTKEIGLSADDSKKLINDMTKVRNEFNDFKNILLTGGNLNVANGEFMKLMSERMRNIFNSEYKILDGKSILPWKNYKPTDSVINDVQQVFKRFAKEKGVELGPDDLDAIINDIVENVRINPATKTPEFPLSTFTALDDETVQLINIADNIKGGQFKPTSLIQSKKDLRTFQRFFGQKRDLRNTIINVMQDLSTLTAKDEFYNNLIKESDELIKNGERSILYPTRQEAVVKMPYQKIIADKRGLNIKSPLGEQVYTNPVNGYFTSQEMADALNFSERLLFDNLAKDAAYQTLFLIPKGLTQISKTILGPFTHTRNFITASQFALGTGNLFKDPRKIVSNFKQAFNTIQPQLLYRNTPKDQQLYKFLLEEQVVSSSASARDIAGLLDDIGKGGDVYMRLFGKFGQAMKKIYNVAGDVYVAEDDIWKTYNFLSEFDTYKNAYTKALDKGLIKKMPTDLDIMRKSADIVRNTVPNYNYVGSFVQAFRRLPVGNFMSFPAEVTRTAGNIYHLGMKEAKDPILRAVGLKRLASFGATIAALPTVAGAVLKGLYGVTSATISAIREFLPDFSADSTIFAYKDEKGDIKYIDASGAMVYDTIINPVQSVIAGVDRERVFDEDAPLTKGVLEGLSRGISRFARPFIDESIYFNTLNNLLVRKGVTADGRKLWNDDAPWGTKVYEAAKYALTEVAPLSYKQMKRLGLAMQDKPGDRGEKFDVSDEIAGFYGLSPIKIDPIESLNYKINEFKTSIRNTRNLFTKPFLSGGEISENEIIENYILANAQRYKAFNQLKRKIKASSILEASEKDLRELFNRRQEPKNYRSIQKNRFMPFSLTKPVKKEFERQTEELLENFDDIERPARIRGPLLRTLKRIEREMKRIPLGENFYDYIDVNKYISQAPAASGERQFASLPQMPMPSSQVVNPQPMMTADGLTPTENALLTEGEKQIRLKQRGMA
jgi:hypothetical protein